MKVDRAAALFDFKARNDQEISLTYDTHDRTHHRTRHTTNAAATHTTCTRVQKGRGVLCDGQGSVRGGHLCERVVARCATKQGRAHLGRLRSGQRPPGIVLPSYSDASSSPLVDTTHRTLTRTRRHTTTHTTYDTHHRTRTRTRTPTSSRRALLR
jgi:hypothetical protein